MEQHLKQRLVGAIVLVSLAVIFIPIILEGPDDEWTPRNHSIPEPPRMDYRASMQLALPDAAPQPDTGSDEPPDRQPPPPVTEPQAPQPAPEPVATAAPEPVPPARIASPAAMPAGWYVQVGSFSQRMNASGLRERLKSAGHDTHLQTSGKTYRVLVGPSDSRELAEKLRDRLLSEQQLKGLVVEHSG